MGYMLVLSSVVLSLVSHSSAQVCTQTVPPANYIAFPTLYNSVSVINPQTPGCGLFLNTQFQCDYTVILGDGAMVPSPPDLTNSTYLRHFLAWQRGSPSPYVDFDLTGATSGVTAIELSFLNSPANRISLPDITLSRVQDGNPNPIPSRILSNQDLTQTDNQIRTIIVRPLISQSSLNLRINFGFTNFHDFDWIFLSEVRFCTNPPSLFTPNIVFLAPVSSIVQPSVDNLRRGSTELVCTVSNEGSYTWQWERDNSVIGNNGDFRITIGDGSRTTKLTISNLDFSDAGTYRCRATAIDLSNRVHMNLSVQEIQFPELIITTPDITGYQQTGEVTLTCELHGYQSRFSPPVWLDTSSNSISTSSKYTITMSDGANMIILQDGTTRSSVIVSLTIHNLTSADEGSYTCRGPTGVQRVTQLTVDIGTPPPTTLPPTTTSTPIIGGVGTTTPTPTSTTNETGGPPAPRGASNTGVIVAVIVVVLIILAAAIAIAVVFVILYIKIREGKINISPTPHGNSYIEVNPRRRLTKEDIKWHVSTNDENDSDPAHVYSMVDKNRDRDSLPQVPPQSFNETNFQYMGFTDAMEDPQFEDGDLYTQPGLKAPHRRLTNSTKPKLAKITTVDPHSVLDSNPIYESASVVVSRVNGSLDTNLLYSEPDSRNSFTTVSVASDGVYSEATNPPLTVSNSSLKSSTEPLYSEALNPTQFTSSKSNSTEPLYSEAIKSKNFKSDSKALSSISSSTEPVYSEAINPSIFTPDMDKSDTSLLPYGPVYALPEKIKPSKYLIVTPENVEEKSQLGIGQFGEVVLAETVGLSEADLKLGNSTDKSARILVAVKKLRDQADSSMRESFEKEIKFMSGLSDENIVRLLAVCDKEPKFIVIEYMENGDLYQYLNQRELATSMKEIGTNQITVSTLLYMGVQIASGMRYLASLKFVHRDLASRNCLVGKNHRVKISDFGMSRNLYQSVYYRVRGRAMLPIRWMAKESFYGRFSEKTDIWSFGVTLWEIFTLGRFQPYEELNDQDIIQDAVRNQQRQLLEKPDACPDKVYSVMLRCWEYKLTDRATFAEVCTTLNEIHLAM